MFPGINRFFWVMAIIGAVVTFVGNEAYARTKQVEVEGYKESEDMLTIPGGKIDEKSSKAQESAIDPFRPANRVVYSFNRFLDTAIFNPMIKTYRLIVPEPGRKMVTNAVKNIVSPITVVNAAAQGDVQTATDTFWRFVVNSTMGIGGLFDVAKEAGLEEKKTEDFGQTLGKYGIAQGPYIVLPVLGPSTVRDTVGRVVDVFTSPFTYYLSDDALIAEAAIVFFDSKERYHDSLESMDSISLDPYSAMRSLYLQHRENQVKQ